VLVRRAQSRIDQATLENEMVEEIARAEEGMEADDLLCSRNARPQKALVGRAQWKIIQPPSLRDNERAWKEHLFRSMRGLEDQPGYPVEEEVLDSFQTRQLSSPNLGTRCLSFMPMIFNCPSCSHSWIQFFRSLFQVRGNVIAEDHASS